MVKKKTGSKYFDQWQPLSAIQPRMNNRPNLQRDKNPPLF